ncbi:hypothetical protein [Streptomyces sp. NPDC047009]
MLCKPKSFGPDIGVERVLLHCYAGQSRTPAVAAITATWPPAPTPRPR